jgi:hypothetical protein
MYSIEGMMTNPVLSNSTLAANPELFGMRFLDIFDLHIKLMTDANLMIIVNNHNSKSGWCCHYSQDEGLWYAPPYSAEQWIESLVFFAKRYKDNPMVVAYDLRNEVHDYGETALTWGNGDRKTDWALAATEAGNAVLDVTPGAIIVVMAMCFGADLRPMRKKPIELSVSNKVVYQTHNYLQFNYFDQISEMLLPWREVQGWTLALLILILLGLSTLTALWYRVRKPKPTVGVVIVSFAGWIAAWSATIAIISNAFLGFSQKFCSAATDGDVMPWVWGSLSVLIVSVFAFAFGMFLIWCHNRRLQRLEKPTERRARDNSGCYSPAAHDCTPQGGFFSDAQNTVPSERGENSAESIPAAVSYGASPDGSPEDGASPDGVTAPLSLKHRENGVPPAALDLEGAAKSPPQKLLLGCCAPGWHSWKHVHGPGRSEKKDPPVWDVGLCCGLQCFILLLCLLVISGFLHVFSNILGTYWWMERHLDGLWGFALDEHMKYTAPVWMGEFGQEVRGSYWLNFVRYLSKRDVDFAYWAINGLKWAEGTIDTSTGNWQAWETPLWVNETFGLLEADYETVRHPWKMLDLRALMDSPARLVADTYPCSRDNHGSCGER